MLFAITCLDKPESLALRTTTRPDHAAPAMFASDDPYAQAALFASTTIHGFRAVFQDGTAL